MHIISKPVNSTYSDASVISFDIKNAKQNCNTTFTNSSKSTAIQLTDLQNKFELI